MQHTQQTHSLPHWAQAELLSLVCKSHGLSIMQARNEEARNTRLADTMARELQSILKVLGKAYTETAGKKRHLRERTSRAIGKSNGTSLRRELAAAIKKSDCRLTPLEALRLDAKSPTAFNHARGYIQPGKRLSDQEALIVYSCSRKTCLERLSRSDIERGYLTQDSALVKAARTYCRTIGLNA